jgi:hypothetical protein
MEFKYNFLTQTQLGKIFGVSSYKIGEWPVQVGLRTEANKPSAEAHRGGYCETAPSGTNGYHWVWHAEQTVKALQKAGHVISPDASEELIEPPVLEGPFTLGRDSKTVLNADGTVALRATSGQTAQIVLKILDVAQRHGVIERLVQGTVTQSSPAS